MKPWFERRFEFPYPAELLPDVLARLKGTPARLEEALAGRDGVRLIRPCEGEWSAQEHAGHLFDMEALWLARVEDFAPGRDELTAADLTNRRTFAAEHNARRLEDILAQFRSARGTLLDRVERLDAAQFDRALPHPRLRIPMRLVDHLYFVAEHDDHHLVRIGELLNGGD